MKLTYRSAGVDLTKVKITHRTVGALIRGTHNLRRGVISGYGHYAGLIEIGDKVVAMHTDGVGTKVLVAQMAGRFDTIGIDCVAMNVNDVICVGAEPVAFVDYIALKKPDEKLVREIAKGLVRGARQASVAIIGGETAIMPDVITGHGNAFDLAGTVIGVAEKDGLVLGNKIRNGDIIVGVESSGLHSNGYTLARKVLLRKYKLRQKMEEIGASLAEELLRPTRIYVRPVLEVLKKEDVHGLAHITGGSFTKLTRLTRKYGFELDSMPEPSGIFRLIQRTGRIDSREMYRTFNMGIGFCLIVPKDTERGVMRAFARRRMKSSVIGSISRRKGVRVGKMRIA